MDAVPVMTEFHRDADKEAEATEAGVAGRTTSTTGEKRRAEKAVLTC